MKNAVCLALAISVMAFVPSLIQKANADEWDHLTKVTFSQPVEIPGQVLQAGTYWFKLMDSQSNRNIVQIYNSDNTRQVALILALPDYRVKPADKTVITFAERAANSPEAVKAWFYPGDNYGQEFVYPKPRAMQLAKASNQAVPSMPANMEADTKMAVKSSAEAPAKALRNTQVKAEQPSGEEVEIGEIVTTPPQLLAQNKPPAAPNVSTASAPAKTLPKTAGSLPLISLSGLLFAAAGLLVRFAARTATQTSSGN
jgi:hypothetical protein